VVLFGNYKVRPNFCTYALFYVDEMKKYTLNNWMMHLFNRKDQMWYVGLFMY